MILPQHLLLSYISTAKGNIEKFKKMAPYIAIPDAIRMYTKKRQTSHFEESKDGSETAWIKYPKDLKKIDEFEVNYASKKEVEQDLNCVIGETTHIPEFEKHNKHLSKEYYDGVKEHLAQDVIFDECIREYFDCSEKYEDKYIFNEETMNGKQMRQKVQEIGDYGVYVLSYIAYRQYGVKTNQEWFDKNVKETFEESYSKELADNTNNFINVRKDINQWISEGDWSHLNEGPIKIEQYLDMYERALSKMQEVKENKSL